MSRRVQNILLTVFALGLGGMLYVCFRGTTYVAVAFRRIPFVDLLCQYTQHYGDAFSAFYLPDFLWGFSFCCMLNAIYIPKMKGTVICGGSAFLMGVAWELMQYTHLVTGTGDVLDMLTYLLAALLSTIINLGGNC